VCAAGKTSEMCAEKILPTDALPPINRSEPPNHERCGTYVFPCSYKEVFAESLATSVLDKNLFSDNLQNKMTAPPQYTDRDEEPSTGTSDGNLAPPPYHLEQLCIPVGGTVPKVPFVSVSQLRVHLGLLRAFRELRNRVTDLEANPEVRAKLPPLAQELEPPERWTWFLELALER
jgi:hypothetical protein